MSPQTLRYGTAEIAAHFGVTPDRLPRAVVKLVEEADFTFHRFEGEERDRLILRILRELERPLEMAGKHRHARWEAGWSENLEDFRKSDFDLAALIPRFVRRGEPVRMQGDYIQPHSREFDVDYIRVLVTFILAHYMADTTEIHEFGCGTAQNLVPAARLFPGRPLYGYDWAAASREIIAEMARHHGFNIHGRVLDMFNPGDEVKLGEGAGVLTVGSLEQLGTEFEAFLDFLLRNKPKVVVNLDCFNELHDPERLPDVLAERYDRKRNYLFGWVTRLRELEAEGRIEILALRRTYGSLFHDGHSFVAWRPR